MASILQPGRNCWRVEPATRAKVLVDGDAYFAAFREAALRARHSILILSWDVDRRTKLVRGTPADDLPAELGPFLNALLRRSPTLRIHVLNWDFAMLYATDRELLPGYKADWSSHERLHFHLDDQHPFGASHHQKIVVVDDGLAFVGGLDLTTCRWDTPEHQPADPRRVEAGQEPYTPFHDIQIMVEGRVAATLGDLSRERWRRATGMVLHPVPEPGGPELWPDGLEPDLTDTAVAISRTEPAFKDWPAVREVKRLYLDSIAAARRWIYLENQYFTAHSVGEALAARLREPRGPEIVVVTRAVGESWLERYTMIALRCRLLQRLQKADVYGRLRVYHAHREGLETGPIRLHSKLMMVDGALLRVGSANLNNRSMGLDTECDLTIEVRDERHRDALIGVLGRLLGEHLGAEPREVMRRLSLGQSLIATIESLRSGPRSLEPVEAVALREMDTLIAHHTVVDPERPVDTEVLAREICPGRERPQAGKRLAGFAAFLLAAAALAAAWRWTFLGDWLDRESLARTASLVQSSGTAPFWVLGAYALASLAAVPVTLLILLTALAFGPLAGFGYGLAGSLLGAALAYGIGRVLGRDAVRRLAGSRLNALSRRLARRGLLAMLAVRLVPVAPFTVVNLICGASHIRFRDFLLGTLVGMAPGILAVTIFADRIGASLRNPSPESLGLMAAVAAALALTVWKLRDWLAPKQPETGGGG
jgi:phosphatidylserine/phosphatidylglycerophosphate/cardiolipin synthase-like enzyme/uncharacterized membrane protein YdjX (TVP38/TMEM64 family)